MPPLLLAVSPLATVIGANLGAEPLRGDIIARSLLVVALVTVVLLAALRLLQRDLAARAAWLSWFLILFNLYGASAEGLRRFDLPIWPVDPGFAVAYTLSSALIAAIATRPWQVRPRNPMPLTIAAALFLLVALAPAASGNRRPDQPWQPPADALIASSLAPAPNADFTPSRDIYYIVLDSLGRADALQRGYGLDLGPFIAALQARGFYVADAARSNYAQTFLSLASTLNLNYLDDLARAVGPATTDRAPLQYLVQQNALMRMASRAGYRIVAIGSDTLPTDRFEQADVCVCPVEGLDQLELAAMDLTPLAAAVTLSFSSGEDPYAGRRRKIVDAFATLETYERGPGRTFCVRAHPRAASAVRAGKGRQPAAAAAAASQSRRLARGGWTAEGVHQRIPAAVRIRD